ncbi:hypothetical protein LINPERPRIM_LOCUS25970 [Linum perenne]
MAVFKLESDKQFLRTFKGDPDIYVFEYLDDPNVFEMIRASDSSWRWIARVGHSPAASFTELEVLGVRIRSNQLAQLANDLTLTDHAGQTFHLIVNRQGLCFLYVNSPSSIMRLRINDYFGWSRNRWDMSSGAVLVSSASDGYLKKLVEEKDKQLEAKDKELAALKLAMKALIDDM